MKHLSILFILLITVLALGCEGAINENGGEGGGSGSEGVTPGETIEPGGDVPSAIKGMWKRLDEDQNLYLAEKSDNSVEVVSDTLIKITESGASQAFYGIRHGTNQASARIQIGELDAGGSGELQGIINKEDVSVTLTDKNNSENIVTVQTDSNGVAEATNLITSTYNVSIELEEAGTNLTAETEVEIVADEDVGILTPVSEGTYNFKTTVTTFPKTDDEYADEEEFVYGDSNVYDVQIRFRNTGSQDALAVSYAVSTEDPLIEIVSPATLGGILGTVEPYDETDSVDEERILDLQIRPAIFSSIGLADDVYYKDVQISVITTDVLGQQWQDYASVRIFRRKMKIDLITDGNTVNGFMILDDHSLLRIEDTEKTFWVPFRPDTQYKILIANTSAYNEAVYSFGVNTDPASLEGFTDTASYEPNNTEANAETISLNESLVSYLHKGDLDYYIIDMESDTETLEPLNLQYVLHTIHDTINSTLSTVGNEDSNVSPGESLRFNVSVQNTGTSTAAGVTVTLSTESALATVDSSFNSSTVGDVTTGETKETSTSETDTFTFQDNSSGDFLVHISNDAQADDEIEFTLTMTDEGGNVWTDTFVIIVADIGANLELDDTIVMGDTMCIAEWDDILEYHCKSDGAINQGDLIMFNLLITNSGSYKAVQVEGILSTTHSCAQVVEEWNSSYSPEAYDGSIGDIEPGVTADCDGYTEDDSLWSLKKYHGDYVVQIYTDEDCSEDVPFEVPLTLTMMDAMGNTWTDTFNITVETP